MAAGTFQIVYHTEAAAEIRRLRGFHRRWVLDAIGKHLSDRPMETTGKKKRLTLVDGTTIRQLRVGGYRVFYDVDVDARLVIVRNVRWKGRNPTESVL